MGNGTEAKRIDGAANDRRQQKKKHQDANEGSDATYSYHKIQTKV